MKKIVVKKLVIAAAGVLMAVLVSLAYSHCQIPCGIYDDAARFAEIAENVTTIEKSITQLTELSKESVPNYNQIVRWVENKEKHADDTSHIITYYFMAQRIKPAEKTDSAAYDDYVKKLTLLHQMLIECMKAKQTTDPATVARLRAQLAEFEQLYLGKSAPAKGLQH
jgi:nickel superoxide dismutase